MGVAGAGVRTVRRWGTALPQRPARVTQYFVTRNPRTEMLPKLWIEACGVDEVNNRGGWEA